MSRYASVAITRDESRKCTKMNMRVRRRVGPAYPWVAIPQAMPVRSWKDESR